MKSNFHHISLARLCAWFGLTRQAYYQNSWKAIETTIEEGLVLQQVRHIRQDHPRMGTRKLYEKLQPLLMEQGIKMGRDALFTLLASHKLLVKRRKRRVHTTQSFHWLRKYPNLIRGFQPTAPDQLWVSDITYWKLKDRYVYISFITDAYSHKIVGYQLAETLEAIESIKALQMALSACKRAEGHKQLIHHSDRGIQYCSKNYVKLLQDNKIKISMSENGDPLENAIAERVNGIIKGEYLYEYPINKLQQAKERLDDVVNLYNSDRPHMSISNLTPDQIHYSLKTIKTQKLWKNYYKQKDGLVNQLQD